MSLLISSLFLVAGKGYRDGLKRSVKRRFVFYSRKLLLLRFVFSLDCFIFCLLFFVFSLVLFILITFVYLGGILCSYKKTPLPLVLETKLNEKRIWQYTVLYLLNEWIDFCVYLFVWKTRTICSWLWFIRIYTSVYELFLCVFLCRSVFELSSISLVNLFE